MKLNETEWQYSLIESHISSNFLKCISDYAIKNFNSRLITFNKLNNICKYYKYYLLNETVLIESNGDFIYSYQISKYTYNLKGIKYRDVSAGCQVYSLILLPNLNLATGCNLGKIKIWDTTSWTSNLTLTQPDKSNIYSLAILQNQYLVSAGQNGPIAVWDYETGVLKKMFYGHVNAVYSMIILNNNDIVTGSCDEIKIWNINYSNFKFTLSITGSVYGLVQLKNGSLFTMSSNTNIKLWNPFTSNIIEKTNSPDSVKSIIQLRNEDLLIGNNDNKIRIYDPINFQTKKTLFGHGNDIVGLLQLQNDDLASSSWDNTVRIWDWNTKSLKYNLIGHTNQVVGLAELPNGYLVSAGIDSKIIIWN